MLPYSAFECFYIRPVWCVGHTHSPHSMRLEQSMEVKITRVVDQHSIAWLQKEAAYQVDSLRSRFSKNYLLWRRLDASSGHSSDKKLAQRRVAERLGGLGQRYRVGPGQRTKGPTPSGFTHQHRRPPPHNGRTPGGCGCNPL